MTGEARVFFVTTLAVYQTDFWAEVGKALRAAGHAVRFLAFDDRSKEALEAAGFTVHACTPAELARPVSEEDVARMVERFDLRPLPYWLSHERITFGVRDQRRLARKLHAYLGLAERAFEASLAAGERPVLVQELGGFASVIGSYFAARRLGIDNWFIEPSFFRGRLFYLKNTFAALRVQGPLPEAASADVEHYLADTLASRAIVIPEKDRHQYTTAFRKVVNARNVRRLAEKIVDKHVRGKHQEFGHIGHHVMVHARMLTNSVRMRSAYTPLSAAGRFVYYPLHVPADMALTLRSPQYLDQLALIDFIARSVPHTHKVAIKEHPAMIGAVPADRLAALLERYDNLVLLPPSTNNYAVLGATDAVVSVNSKSGAEALLVGTPVVVMGDAFYRDSPLVRAVDRLDALPGAIADALREGRTENDPRVARYFEAVWRASVPGELYAVAPERVSTFTAGMLEAIG